MRKLCLVLNENDSKYLILKSGKNNEVDHYTASFENSDEIRKCYKKQIEEYLNNETTYLKNYSHHVNGDIVLLDEKEKRVSVWYKRHELLFKKIFGQLINYLKKSNSTREIFIKKLKCKVSINEKLFLSPDVYYSIVNNTNKNKYEKNISAWINKSSDLSGDKKRLILSVYKELIESKGLSTIKQLYKEETGKDLNLPYPYYDQESFIKVDLGNQTVIGGVIYDELELWDLDDLKKIDDIYGSLPDGLGKQK